MTDPLDPHGRTPEPSFGPDEEGDVPLPEGERSDDAAAWVHEDAEKQVGG